MIDKDRKQLEKWEPEILQEQPRRRWEKNTMWNWLGTRQGQWSFFVVLLVVAILCVYFGFSICTHHAEDAYGTVKEERAVEVESEFYTFAFNYAEKKYHVSNRATISLDGAMEQKQLEVLRVSDSEFVIENGEDNDSNITSWVEVQGIGVFTVNLQAAEIIKDDQRQYVRVRLWEPELTNCTIEKTGECFWKNDWRNDSTKVGVELSKKQIKEGRQLVEDAIRQNRSFHESARSAAERSIQSLVKSWNPQLPNLTVEVEFIDAI